MLNGSIIATIVAGIPFLFYIYEYVPDTKTWVTWFGVYDSNYYESANVGVWVLMMKLVPLLLSLIWFFTCKHWWYHVLIIPIAMFSIQTIGAFSDTIIFIDELHIIWLLPFMALVIPSVYLIRAKMFNKINYADKTMEELEAEFMIKPKGIWNNVKQYF
ncbi:hypothetical protein J1C55_08400 [Winogradskyella sp. E313]|uniref:Uncharacterized protein n=1 Tax=Winogradskyella immobilis TaxID=2816852 RepID=A0ABS8ENB8_9FLAO|nr:hypothetical protein [Winogradskyella immobilis]